MDLFLPDSLQKDHGAARIGFRYPGTVSLQMTGCGLTNQAKSAGNFLTSFFDVSGYKMDVGH